MNGTACKFILSRVSVNESAVGINSFSLGKGRRLDEEGWPELILSSDPELLLPHCGLAVPPPPIQEGMGQITLSSLVLTIPLMIPNEL